MAAPFPAVLPTAQYGSVDVPRRRDCDTPGAERRPTACRGSDRLRVETRLGSAVIRNGRIRTKIIEQVHAVPPLAFSWRRALPPRGGTARRCRWSGTAVPARRSSARPPTPPSDEPVGLPVVRDRTATFR